MQRYLGLAAFWFITWASLTPASGYSQSVIQTYNLVPVSSPPVQIDSVRVFVDKDGAYIHGEITEMTGYTVDPPDYIDISVISPNGQTLRTVHSDYFPKPIRPRSSRFGRQPSFYSARLDFIPPPHSTIKAVYVRQD